MSTEDWWKEEGRSNRELINALTTRPLSVAELQRVGEMGYHLLVIMNTPYQKDELQREFAALLAVQRLIQVAAAREAHEPPAAGAVRDRGDQP